MSLRFHMYICICFFPTEIRSTNRVLSITYLREAHPRCKDGIEEKVGDSLVMAGKFSEESYIWIGFGKTDFSLDGILVRVL